MRQKVAREPWSPPCGEARHWHGLPRPFAALARLSSAAHRHATWTSTAGDSRATLDKFGYYHHWSHAAAYRETARQTGEMTGFHWSGGLFLNYLFAFAWLADVVWWWVAPGHFARRSARLAPVWHAFFFFMVFNGAVVFATGPVRWLGVLICAGLIGLWWWRPKTDLTEYSRMAIRLS